MKQLKNPLLLLSLAFCMALTACNDDDDNVNPPAVTTFPHTMNFHSITNQSLQLWVGGQAVSTANLELEDLFEPWDYEVLVEAYYENQSFTFTADSLGSYDEWTGEIVSQPYYFQNNTLFITTDFFGNTIDLPIATGNFSQLEMRQYALRYCISDDNTLSCGSEGGTTDFTVEDALETVGLSSFAAMSPSDTIVLYNQTLIFRP